MRIVTLAITLLGIAVISGCRSDAPPMNPAPSSPAAAPAARSTPTVVMPTATPVVAVDLAMYQAVVDTLFTESSASGQFVTDALTQTVVYVQPTFQAPDTRPVPSAVIAMITTYTDQLQLTRVAQRTPGGLAIAISAPLDNPAPPPSSPTDGPVIFVLVETVNDNGCGNFMSVGFQLARNDVGWRATQYVFGVC